MLAHHVYLQEVAADCRITAMPTFQVWKNGQKIDETVGANMEKIMALLNAYSSQ